MELRAGFALGSPSLKNQAAVLNSEPSLNSVSQHPTHQAKLFSTC